MKQHQRTELRLLSVVRQRPGHPLDEESLP